MEQSSTLQSEYDQKLAHERLVMFSEQSDIWMWETNAEHIFTYFTDNVERLTGIQMTELLGSSRLERALQDSEKKWQSHANDLLKHRPFKDFSYVLRSEDGDRRHLIITGWPFYDEAGEFLGFRGTGRDCTTQVLSSNKQIEKEENLLAEIELQRSNLETVLENLSQSVMWFDKYGIIRLNNAQTKEILGFDDDEYKDIFTLKQHLTLMAERGDFGNVDVTREVEARLARLCEEAQGEKSYRIHVKSTDRFLDVHSRSLADGSRILTHTDVTQEARKDIEISEREVMLSTVINNVDYGILLMDSELNVEMANEKFSQLWGIETEYLASGPSFQQLLEFNRYTGYYPIDGGDEQKWQEYTKERTRAIYGGEPQPIELQRGDGKTLIFSIVCLPGNRRMVTYFDVTIQKEREAQLKDMQHDLAQANEMLEHRVEQRTNELRKTQSMLVKKERQALLGDLVSSLCHELRNPLNALNTSLFLIRRNVEKDFPKLTKAFDRSERTIERCTNILTDLYEFALVEKMQTQSVKMEPLIKKALEAVKIPKAFDVLLDIEPNLPECEIDERQISEVISKVATNAAQAVADNLNPKSNPKIEIYAGDCGSFVEIMISDNGAGMDGEVFERALEPLYSTRGFGVGLGLPISEQILKRHGGDIQIESQDGQGTTVTISIPVKANVSEAA